MKTNQVQQDKDIDAAARYNTRKSNTTPTATTTNIPHTVIKGKTSNTIVILIPNIVIKETENGILIKRSK